MKEFYKKNRELVLILSILLLFSLIVGVILLIRYIRKKNAEKKASQIVSSLIMPMFPPVIGPITSRYGMRVHPKLNIPKMHNGTDIAVPTGSPLYSPWSGTVSDVRTTDVGGNEVKIDLDNGFSVGYSHLSEFAVNKGDRVNRGEVIGLSGDTGRVTGPHLHFSMKLDGQFINPEDYFTFSEKLAA